MIIRAKKLISARQAKEASLIPVPQEAFSFALTGPPSLTPRAFAAAAVTLAVGEQ